MQTDLMMLVIIIAMDLTMGCKVGVISKDKKRMECSMKGSYCVCHHCQCDYGQIMCRDTGQGYGEN